MPNLGRKVDALPSPHAVTVPKSTKYDDLFIDQNPDHPGIAAVSAHRTALQGSRGMTPGSDSIHAMGSEAFGEGTYGSTVHLKQQQQQFQQQEGSGMLPSLTEQQLREQSSSSLLSPSVGGGGGGIGSPSKQSPPSRKGKVMWSGYDSTGSVLVELFKPLQRKSLAKFTPWKLSTRHGHLYERNERMNERTNEQTSEREAEIETTLKLFYTLTLLFSFIVGMDG